MLCEENEFITGSQQFIFDGRLSILPKCIEVQNIFALGISMSYLPRHLLSTVSLLLSTFLVCLCCFSQPIAAQTKMALVVGVEKYESGGFQHLNFAEEDALELKTELEKLGFETVAIVGEEATLEGVNRGLASLYATSKKLKKDDIVLVFLSGHGVQKLVRKTENGEQIEKEEPFFVPNNAKDNDVGTWLNLNDVINRLKEDSGSSNNIVLMDASRESMDKGAKGIDGGNIESLPRKVTLFFASQPGHRSFESPQVKHGIFTYYLLEGLRGKAADDRNEITLLSLINYVSKSVQNDSPRLLGVDASDAQQPNLMGNMRGSLSLGTVGQTKRGETPKSPTTSNP